MKIFKVEIKEVLSRVIEVEAIDLESAKEKVSFHYYNEEIVLDYEDLTESSIEEYKEVK